MAKVCLHKRWGLPLFLTLTLGFSGISSAEILVGTSVNLRALDKVTASTQDFTVNLGESLVYGSLRVDIKHCEKKPPEDIPETFAFLQIFEAQSNGQGQSIEREKVFSGWMLSSRPAISALDHPVYDIWVLGCNVPIIETESEPNQDQKPQLRQ